MLDSTLLPINAPATLFMHLLQDVSVGVLFGYLRLRYDSVLLPTFAHGLLNTMGAVTFLFFTQKQPMLADFGGPIGTLLLLALAAFVLQKAGNLHFPSSAESAN